MIAKLDLKKETPEQLAKQIKSIETDLVAIERFATREFSELV
jgi:hypothetical protein